MTDHDSCHCSRRALVKAALGGAALLGAGAGWAQEASSEERPVAAATTGPIGFTSFIHPTARMDVDRFDIGAASLIDAFVTLEGRRARIGNAVNLQDNDRLLDFRRHGAGRGDLRIGDGTFTAHGVTFVGRVRIGEACGTGINAIVQNARVGDATFIGLVAQVLGQDPTRLIDIPEASLVLFGARIRRQADVAANTIPVPAPFTLFFADVDQENLVLARGFNLLYRAAARMLPFSGAAGDPRNPGDDFPSVEEAFGKLAVAPPTVYRRGTGVVPARQATLGDLSFERFEPMFPMPAPSTPAPDSGGLGLNAPPSASPDAGARFVVPRVASPELVAAGAIVAGGCELEHGVEVGPGSYVLGDVAPSVFVGENTRIGRNSSLHELTYTACRVGARCRIGDRVVLHGPVEIGDDCVIGNGAVLFGPTVRPGVRIGARTLVFGPVEVTQDLPADSIVVAPGNEFLIAPSAPSPGITLAQCSGALPAWQRAQDAGGWACGCGIGSLLQAAAWV